MLLINNLHTILFKTQSRQRQRQRQLNRVMEKQMKILVMLIVVVLMGQSTEAKLLDCYANCYGSCVTDMRKTIPVIPRNFLPCAYVCLKRCSSSSSSSQSDDQLYYYCNLGCGIDSCQHTFDGN